MPLLLRSLHGLAPSNDPHCVLASSEPGLPVAVVPIPASGTLTNDFHATPRIFVAHAGLGRRSYRRGLRSLELQTAPRMIEVVEAGLLFERVEWSGSAGRCVQIQFPDAEVQAMTEGELQALRLRTRHEVFDERVSSLALQAAEEVVSGMPSGMLFMRGIGLALLGLLSSCHSEHAPTTRCRKLTPEQTRRICELVRTEFGRQLTIERMASELHLSPYHFARLFRTTFEMTPHEYVQCARLDAAVRGVGRGDRSLGEIALTCGFASASHMTATMRRQLGFTPRALRQASPRPQPVVQPDPGAPCPDDGKALAPTEQAFDDSAAN